MEKKMENGIWMQSDRMSRFLQEMEQKLTGVRDSLRVMEEQGLLLQNKWEGQANSEWTVQLLRDRELVFERVGKLAKITEVLREISFLLADAEWKNNSLAGEE